MNTDEHGSKARRGQVGNLPHSQAEACDMLRSFGFGDRLVLIAGPCVIESEEHVHFLAGEIKKTVGAFIFKASFDKANRSSVTAYRGPGLKEGLRILKSVRDAGFPVLTDIHEPAQAAVAAESVDILQIPAFLCRQTDLLVEAGRTGHLQIGDDQKIAPRAHLLNRRRTVRSFFNDVARALQRFLEHGAQLIFVFD